MRQQNLAWNDLLKINTLFNLTIHYNPTYILTYNETRKFDIKWPNKVRYIIRPFNQSKYQNWILFLVEIGCSLIKLLFFLFFFFFFLSIMVKLSGNLVKRRLIWNQSFVMENNFFYGKQKLYKMIFISVIWIFMDNKTVDVNIVRRWVMCFGSVDNHVRNQLPGVFDSRKSELLSLTNIQIKIHIYVLWRGAGGGVHTLIRADEYIYIYIYIY